MNRTKRSPHQVVHSEVIAELEKTLTWMKANLQRKVLQGEMTDWQRQNKIATQEYLVKKMKEKDPQKQLFKTDKS